MLGKRKSADDNLNIFLTFQRQKDLTFHGNCELRRQFAWSAISYFLGKKEEKYHQSSAEFAHSTISVKLINADMGLNVPLSF